MYADQPPFGADDRVRATHFGKHPLGRSVLGTVESIEALPVEKMREYFEQRYSPGNITLVGAGRVNFEELVQTAEELCGSWKPFATGRETPAAKGHGPFECVQKDSAAMEYFIQMSNGPTSTDSSRFAARLLATIVGDDSGSRLFWELVDPGLAEHASLGFADYQGAGLFITYMSCEPAQAADNIAAIRRVYEKVQAEGITAVELAQAKSKSNSRWVLRSERPRGRLFTTGANWLHRHEYRTLAEDMAAVDSVTTEQISAVLKKHPITEGTSIAIGPLTDLAMTRE
jgi:predicted Zn-dependent peptidase